VSSGSYTFKYRVTAPHKGTFKVYLTKPGYDPAQPLGWDDLDLSDPVATATDPVAAGGFYTFSGTLPERSGKQLLYAIWQRSDSPEAFYSCSDVTFGGDLGGTAGSQTPVPSASAPSEEQIEDGSDKSTVEHDGHGDDDASTSAEPVAGTPSVPANDVKAAGTSQNLAETGGDSSTSYLAMGGAATLAAGAAILFGSVRRRAVNSGGRQGR
jgi:chitin-binding protein